MPHDDYCFLNFSEEFQYDLHYYLDKVNFVQQLSDLLTVPSTAQLSLFNQEDYLTLRQLKRDRLDTMTAVLNAF